MGDRELVEALRRGQSSAWAELLGLYLKLVYHVVRRTLAAGGRASEQDVEDVTNDFLGSLVKDHYRARGTLGEPYDLKAWLAVGARRRAIDFVRRRRLASVSLDDASGPGEGTLAEAISAPEPPAAAPAEEYRAAVAGALAVLNPKERLAVQLFYLDGKKYREIARITGMNANSIGPTLLRAVEKMQKALSDRNLLRS
jgi:RNA polymerase sigma factor (sigma-70 family)